MNTKFNRIFSVLFIVVMLAFGGTTFAQESTPEPTPTAEVPVNIDKLSTFDQNPNGLWQDAEVQGERVEMIEMYNQEGQATVIYLMPALAEGEMARRWDLWGSRWEITETGEENPDFDLFHNSVDYIVDRHSRNENVSGLVVDLRGAQPVLVANLFELTDEQVIALLAEHVDTMDPETQAMMQRVTVNLLVSLNEAGEPVYVEDTEFTTQTLPICNVFVNASAGVNFRESAGTNAAVLLVAGYGTTWTATSQQTVDNVVWYEVRLNNELNQTAFVSSEAVEESGDCDQLPAPSGQELTVLVIPVTIDVEATAEASVATCAGATQDGNADGRTLTPQGQAYTVEMWSPFEGILVVPDGETVSGVNGALWVHSSTSCALADAATKGRTIYIVVAGVITQQ